MKVGFIGLGRMGQAMARRLLDGGHDVGVYNRSAEKLKDLIEAGAKPMDSIKAAANYGEAVFTMLADDAAVLEVVRKAGGLVESLPKGGIHICAGTHSVAAIANLKTLHGDAGQILLAYADARPAGSRVLRSGRHGAGRREGHGRALPPAIRRDRASHFRSRPRSGRRPPPSRSPIISCSAAPSRRWARALR